MQPLSPVDALSPAFSRSRSILLPPGPAPGLNAPFRFWFFLKIAVIAALTQSNIYGMIFAFTFEAIVFAIAIVAGASGVNAIHLTHAHMIAGGLTAPVLAAILIGIFIALGVGLFLAWLWCRLRFTLFDLVVYRHGLVSRAWSPYSSQSWRFLGLVLLISLGLILLLAVTAGPVILHFIAAVRHLTSEQLNADPFLVMSHIFPLYGIFFLFAIVAGLVNAIAEDFILPPLALEDAPPGVAFARFSHLLRARFWFVALYMLLRFVLELGLAFVGGIAFFIVLGVLGLGCAGAGFVLYRAFWHAGPGGVAVVVIFCVFAFLLLLAVYLLMALALYGVIAVVKQSYAVWFYGSYYPQLGDRLDPSASIPSPTPPFTPPTRHSFSRLRPPPDPPEMPAETRASGLLSCESQNCALPFSHF